MATITSLLRLSVGMAAAILACDARIASAGEDDVSLPSSERLDAVCQCYAAKGFSGVVLVTRGERTFLQKGYGLADRATGRVNNAESLFELASLSKQFTATAILALEDDGKLSISDALSKHLPYVPEAYQDVTLNQLLTHTSGAPRGGGGQGEDATVAIPEHLATPPQFAAGEGYAYSNAGYAVLAAVVESASGQSFEAFCRERLFTPAGLSSTTFCGAPKKSDNYALGYSANSAGPRTPWQDPYEPLDEFGYEYRGMGGVMSNVVDLRRWMHALQSDLVLTEASRRTLFTAHRSNYACGWEVFTFDDGMRCIGHGGSVRGYASKLWWFPDEGALLVVLSNGETFDYSLLTALRAAMFSPDDGVALAIEEGESRDAEQFVRQQLEDRSWDIWPSARLRIAQEGKRLRAELVIPAAGPTLDDASAQSAADLVAALSRGDTQPLTAAMDSSIPASWPDRMRQSIWPDHVRRWGDLRAAVPIAASSVPGKAADWRAVWLHLEHERGNCLAMVGYRPTGKLQLLVLDLGAKLHLEGNWFIPVAEEGHYESLDEERRASLSFLGSDRIRVEDYTFSMDFGAPVE